MAGQNNLVESKYYSGQGIVLLSDRDSLGRPTGFEHIGNVSALSISMEITELEHKESTTGGRVIDLTLITENSVNVEITAEHFTAKNLAIAMFGTSFNDAAGSVVALIVRGNAEGNKTSFTNHLNLTAVSVTSAGRGTVTFSTIVDGNTVTVDGVAYEAKTTVVAPLTQFALGANDAQAALNLITLVNSNSTRTHEARLGTSTNIVEFLDNDPTNGNSMTLTENTTGSKMVVSGATFAGSAAGAEGTDFDVNDKGGSVTLKSTSTIFPVGVSNIAINYTHSANTRIEAFTTGKVDKWLRFEGLNTARSNKAVVVDIFKFSPNPLDTQALIGDDVAEFVISGNALADTLRPTGESQFFREIIDES